MINRYKIAGKVVEVHSVYPDVHRYCADYRTEASADYAVVTGQEDIDFERKKSAGTARTENRKLCDLPDGYLEQLAVYRKIAEKMLDFDTVLFHGSCIAVDGAGYLFTARSGTGKSTHTRLWRTYFGNRAVMVNDDKPLLHISDKGVTAYGTPYNGKHRLGSNISVPLQAICLLTRAEQNHIEPFTWEQAYPVLLQQIYRPADSALLTKTLSLTDKLADRVKLFRLGCNMDISAAKTAYEGMQ